MVVVVVLITVVSPASRGVVCVVCVVVLITVVCCCVQACLLQCLEVEKGRRASVRPRRLTHLRPIGWWTATLTSCCRRTATRDISNTTATSKLKIDAFF